MPRNIKVIGLGGIGTVLLPIFCRMLAYGEQDIVLTLVDGDTYEPKNLKRQSFRTMGPKAVVKVSELAPAFRDTHLVIRPRAEYVTAANIAGLIEEGDTVILAVDNHKTRHVVSKHCQTLKNVTLLSAGNDLTTGNVLHYLRRNGEDITADLGAYHPEIANPKDKSPDEGGCEEAIERGETQLLPTNAMAACAIWVKFWLIERTETKEKLEGLKKLAKEGKIGEDYFSLDGEVPMQSFARLPLKKKGGE